MLPGRPRSWLHPRVSSPILRQVIAGSLFAAVALGSVAPAASFAEGSLPCDPTWRVTDTPNTPNAQLRAVDARTAADVWAVGYDPLGAQSMHWDGASWTAVPMPVPAGTESIDAFDIAVLAADDAWAVGSRYGSDSGVRAFVQHWNGVAWSPTPLPDLTGVYGQLLGLDAVGPDDVWAVGFEQGSTPGGDPQPLVMHFGGDAWQRVPTPTVAGPNASLLDVRALAPDDVWAVGSRQPRLSSGIGDRTLIEHWDGSSWTVVPSPEADDQVHGLSTVDGSGSDDVWAAGSIGGFRSLLQHWDGTRWSLVDIGLPDSALSTGIHDVEVVNDHDVWAVLGRLRTNAVTIHYDGSTWVEAPGPPARRRYLADVDAAPEGDLWTVGAVLGRHRRVAVAERLCPARLSPTGLAPEAITIPYGSALAWTVPAGEPGTYRLVDDTGLALFDSGPLGQTETFTQRFVAAGTYVVAEAATDTAQTVRVRPAAVPRPRIASGTLKVTWAADDIPSGLVADVQVRHRGGMWSWFVRGTDASFAFTTEDPPGGRVAFRARLRDPGSETASGWSPPAHVVPV